MAGFAAIGLDEMNPLILALDVGEMPLPVNPVPGNSLLSGTLRRAYQ
jgi:hypothetical protein